MTTLHTTDAGPAPADPGTDADARPPSTADPRRQADTHVQINGELASRLMRSTRWQQ